MYQAMICLPNLYMLYLKKCKLSIRRSRISNYSIAKQTSRNWTSRAFRMSIS